MPFYLSRVKLSNDAIKQLMAKPQDRRLAVSKLMESVGGKLHHYFFAFGEYDAVLLLEAPDNASCAAALMAAIGSGSVTGIETTTLMTMEEAVAAMKKGGEVSGSYRPPGT